ncbi:ABC transporter permease subunit [candidate division KSB3 bacterium]|nr:ABC transporter permease subunit [candidate division KSB3 bacterium]
MKRTLKNKIISTVIHTFIYLFLIFWAVVVIFPMIWVLVSSFKTSQEIFFSPWQPPKQLMWDNFARAWSKANIGQYFFNTLFVLTPAIFFTLLFSAMAGYVLARYAFPGNRAIFFMFTGGMLFPVILALVPLFFLLQSMTLLDTHFGLVLVYIAYSLPFTIFFMTGFFKTLPSELLEAAIIDGANHYQLFFTIVIPLAKNGLVSMGIFNFLGQWNQYILPLVLLTSSEKYVLSQGLAFLQHQQRYQSDWSGLFAAITIVMLPTLIVYVIFQSQIQRGLTIGALKG